MQNIARRKIFVATALFLLLCITFWIWQCMAFPTTSDLQRMIESADRVEVRAFLVNNETGGDDFLVLTTPDDIGELAAGIQVVGLWLPLDDLVANSYRVRIIRNGDTIDLIIRGGNRIRSGIWHAKINGFVPTIQNLAQKRGAKMPDWGSLLRKGK